MAAVFLRQQQPAIHKILTLLPALPHCRTKAAGQSASPPDETAAFLFPAMSHRAANGCAGLLPRAARKAIIATYPGTYCKSPSHPLSHSKYPSFSILLNYSPARRSASWPNNSISRKAVPSRCFCCTANCFCIIKASPDSHILFHFDRYCSAPAKGQSPFALPEL